MYLLGEIVEIEEVTSNINSSFDKYQVWRSETMLKDLELEINQPDMD